MERVPNTAQEYRISRLLARNFLRPPRKVFYLEPAPAGH